MARYLTLANLFIGLLLLGTTSFSLYLTPAPINWRSPFQFLRFFLLIAAALVGFHMALPYFFQWKLPFQQGLGSNSDLMVRGVLVVAASIFAVAVQSRRWQQDALVFVAALALLAVGIPELLRVLGILNSTVNTALNYGNAPVGWMLRLAYPFFILFAADVILTFLGGLSLILCSYRFLKA